MANASITASLDPEDVVLRVGEQGSVAAAARSYGLAASTLHAFIKRSGIGSEVDGVRPPQSLRKRDAASELLVRNGVDPKSVNVTGMVVGEWGDPQNPSVQLKVRTVPKWSAVMAARDPGWTRPKPKVRKSKGPKLVAFFGDHHAPHHDPDLHERAVAWLEKFQPDEVYLIGDIADYDAVSRHRSNPDWEATLQECIDASYGICLDYVQAAPNARFRMLDGNHEDRLRNAVLDNLRGAYGVGRAQVSGADREDPVLSLPHLLRLDELQIEHMGGCGEYADYQWKVSPELAARHGWIASKGSGSSALKTIEHLRYSVVIGHTHRQSVVFHTAHDIDGRPCQLVGVEAGTMAKIRGGLGYAIAPDWQQGFATAYVWPDGQFKVSTAQFVNGSLLWDGWRC